MVFATVLQFSTTIAAALSWEMDIARARRCWTAGFGHVGRLEVRRGIHEVMQGFVLCKLLFAARKCVLLIVVRLEREGVSGGRDILPPLEHAPTCV